MQGQDAKRYARSLWLGACRYDKVQNPKEAKFVVFSGQNPHARQYNKIVRLIHAAELVARITITNNN